MEPIQHQFKNMPADCHAAVPTFQSLTPLWVHPVGMELYPKQLTHIRREIKTNRSPQTHNPHMGRRERHRGAGSADAEGVLGHEGSPKPLIGGDHTVSIENEEAFFSSSCRARSSATTFATFARTRSTTGPPVSFIPVLFPVSGCPPLWSSAREYGLQPDIAGSKEHAVCTCIGQRFPRGGGVNRALVGRAPPDGGKNKTQCLAVSFICRVRHGRPACRLTC